MSRLDQVNESLISNPAKRFLEYKNVFTKETIMVKGKPKEMKVFDKGVLEWAEKDESGAETVWVRNQMDVPIKLALLNGDWVNFKGWNDTEKVMYYSNEVNNSDSLISVRNKDGIVYEFTLSELWGRAAGSKKKDEKLANEVKGKLKALGVKQYSSIYAAIKDENDKFELVNIQLKGANLSGSKELNKEKTPSGWWNVSKEFKKFNNIYTHFLEINDWAVEDGEMGEYGILNIVLGEIIEKDDLDALDVLFEELKAYHDAYVERNTPKEDEEVATEVAKTTPTKKVNTAKSTVPTHIDTIYMAEDEYSDDDLPF